MPSSLASLTDSAVKNLGKHKGLGLSLDGLTSLSEAAAKCFGKHREYLSLNGINSLSRNSVAFLAGGDGGLSLNGFESLDQADAEKLKSFKGSLSIGATHISTPVALALSKHSHSLSLPRVQEITVEVAEILSRHPFGFEIGITTLAVDIAAKLKRHGEPDEIVLTLNQVSVLSVEAAAEIAQHSGPLQMCGLRTLSPEVVQILRGHNINSRFGDDEDDEWDVDED